MTNGFVHLQADLAAVEDQIEAAFRALVGRVKRDCLLGDARRILEQS